MSHTWKLLPLAALFALGAFMLISGGTGTQTARADVTSMELDGDVLTIESDAGHGDLTITLSSVESDTDTSMEITDCNNCNEEGDDDETELVIDTDDPDYDEFVEITLDISCPDSDNITITAEDDEGSDDVTYECEPSATATPTVGTAATIVISSSNNNLGCGATSIVTITVRSAGGQPVAAGTIVNIVADKGSVSPASGVTTADGSVFVFYTAPSNSGGEATITAASGSALGATNIDINCNNEPTQAPPPTAAVSGIQPPNTGDGGLKTDSSWNTYAGIALILSSVIATLAVVRQRA